MTEKIYAINLKFLSNRQEFITTQIEQKCQPYEQMDMIFEWTAQRRRQIFSKLRLPHAASILYSQSSAVFSDLQSSSFFTTTPENPKCVLKWRSMFSSSRSGVPISPLGNLDNSVNKEKCPLLLPFRYSLVHFRKILNQTSIFGTQFDSLVLDAITILIPPYHLLLAGSF